MDDEAVATVTQDGVVKPLKNGSIILTATAKDGSNVFATKAIQVVAYATISSLDFGDGVTFTEFNPDIRKYLVYVKEDATQITLTPIFSGGGILRANNSGIWLSENAKEFVLEKTGSTMITLDREDVPDMTDGGYTVEVIKFEGTQTMVSEDGKTFSVLPINIPAGESIILALYYDGVLIERQKANCEEKEISFVTNQIYTSAKVMAWDSLIKLKPFSNAEIVK